MSRIGNSCSDLATPSCWGQMGHQTIQIYGMNLGHGVYTRASAVAAELNAIRALIDPGGGGGPINPAYIDHNLLLNTHNLTTSINHNAIANTHNLTTDIDHDTILNTHQGVDTDDSPTFTGLLFDGSASGTVTIQPAAAAGTYTLTLPITNGAASEFLQTDGNGVLAWAAAGGVTIGTDNQIPFSNAAGTDFDYSAGLTFDGSTFDVTGDITAGTVNVNDKTLISSSLIEITRAGSTGKMLLDYTGSNFLFTTDTTDSIVFAPNGAISWIIGSDGLTRVDKAFFFRDNRECSFGIDKDYSIGYASGTDTFNIADGADLTANVRMTLDAAGDFDFQSGDITTLGDVSAKNATFSSTSFPVVDIIRDTQTDVTAVYGASVLERIMTGGTALDSSGVGFYFKSPNDAGTSKFAGLFGGILSDVSAGAEVGGLILAGAWLGADPASRQDMVVTATGSGIYDSNVRIGAPTLKLGTIFQTEDASSNLLINTIHANVASAGNVAGIGFGIHTSSSARYAKSAIAHERVGSWGQGDLVFYVDPDADGADVTVSDEVLRLSATNANFTGDTIGLGMPTPTYTGSGTVDATIKLLAVVNKGGGVTSGREAAYLVFGESATAGILATGGYIDYDSWNNLLYFGGIDPGGTKRDGFSIDRDTGNTEFFNVKLPDLTFIGDYSTDVAFELRGLTNSATASRLSLLEGNSPNGAYLRLDGSVTSDLYIGTVFTTDTDAIKLIRGDATIYALGDVDVASSLIVDTTTLVVNASGYEDRVGIGTATPAASLHITNGDFYVIGAGDRRFLLGESLSGGKWAGAKWLSSTDRYAIGHSAVDGDLLQLTFNSDGTVDWFNTSEIDFGATDLTTTGDIFAHDATLSNNTTLTDLNIIGDNAHATGGSTVLDLRSKQGNGRFIMQCYKAGSVYIQASNYASTGNVPLIFSGYNGLEGDTLDFKFADVDFNDGDITTAGFLKSTSAVAGQSIIASGLVVNNAGNGTVADDFIAKTVSIANAFVVDASADEVITNVDTKVNTLTALKPVFSDANKVLVSQDITQGDLVVTRKTANSIETPPTKGTISSGTITDAQTWGDGNSINISEVTGAPGIDVSFTFTGVIDFSRVGISAYYTGAIASHYCEIQIYDDTNTTWRTLWTFSGGNSFNYRFSDLPVSAATRVADYINGSSEVKIRFYHPTSGNASYDLYIDYISITD